MNFTMALSSLSQHFHLSSHQRIIHKQILYLAVTFLLPPSHTHWYSTEENPSKSQSKLTRGWVFSLTINSQSHINTQSDRLWSNFRHMHIISRTDDQPHPHHHIVIIIIVGLAHQQSYYSSLLFGSPKYLGLFNFRFHRSAFGICYSYIFSSGKRKSLTDWLTDLCVSPWNGPLHLEFHGSRWRRRRLRRDDATADNNGDATHMQSDHPFRSESSTRAERIRSQWLN